MVKTKRLTILKLAIISCIVVLVIIAGGFAYNNMRYQQVRQCLSLQIGQQWTSYEVSPQQLAVVLEKCDLKKAEAGLYRSSILTKFHFVSETEQWITLTVDSHDDNMNATWYENIKFSWKLL